MQEIKQRRFLRKTRKVGNSCGVLLPKYLLGADVRVFVATLPLAPKKDVMKILAPILEEILGVYFIKMQGKKAEILAVSTKVEEKIEKGRYKIDVVPLAEVKKKREIIDKLKKAKVIINKKLLGELRKGI